ncbi:MAG: hypothetical protein E7378_03365, partial [Clostridiales bacterium]|nr:hypothetical protein [Clostridiales bacterium]
MKSKLLPFLLTICCVITSAFFISGCNSHKCEYTTINHDNAGHWYECECGEVQSGSYSSHFGGVWIIDQDSTCTVTGTQHMECTVCHVTFAEETIPVKQHSMTEWTEKTPATCTQAQVLERHCTTCDTQNETKDGTAALGHTESDWIIDTDSTCTTTGTQHKECTVCHEKLDEETIPVKQHSMTEWTEKTPATCTQAQVLERHCTTCDTQNETK